MGDGGVLAADRVRGLLLPRASMILQPWVPARRDPGAPFDIASAYELLRQQCRGLSDILDALCVGQRSPHFAGNIAAVNATRSSHVLAQHLVDAIGDNEHPIPPTLHVYQSFLAESQGTDGNRPMVLLERISNGTVTHARAMLEFRKRLDNGAEDDAAYIEDARAETFSIRSDGTYFTRGGLFVLGDAAHVIMRGGNIYAESGGVVAVLDPNTTTDSASGGSLALGRTSTTAAQIGDIYGIDLGTLTLQSSTVRAAAPGSVDSAFKSKGLIIETDPLPSFFTAGNRGIGWDSDDDKLKKWDGSTYTEIASASSVTLAEYCGYPSWSNDLGAGVNDPDRIYNWGPFGNADMYTNSGNWVSEVAQGHESDGSRQTSYVAVELNDDPSGITWAFSCGVPEGFSAWAANGLAIKTKITKSTAFHTGPDESLLLTLTAYNPSSGATSTSTRSVSANDSSYTETTIAPPGTWQGGDLLRFTVNVSFVNFWDGIGTVKLGRIRTDWT